MAWLANGTLEHDPFVSLESSVWCLISSNSISRDRFVTFHTYTDLRDKGDKSELPTDMLPGWMQAHFQCHSFENITCLIHWLFARKCYASSVIIKIMQIWHVVIQVLFFSCQETNTNIKFPVMMILCVTPWRLCHVVNWIPSHKGNNKFSTSAKTSLANHIQPETAYKILPISPEITKILNRIWVLITYSSVGNSEHYSPPSQNQMTDSFSCTDSKMILLCILE